jgi:AcrR family transcriptional regulator
MSDANNYHHGNLRDAALSLGLKQVRDRGVSALSLRGLAAELGVSTPALYHHFPSKEGLLAEVALLALTQFDQKARALLKTKRLAASHLEALGMQYVMAAVQEPHLFHLLFSKTSPQPPLGDINEGTPVFGALLSFFNVALSGLPQLNRLERAICSWSVVHGFATLATDGPLRGAVVSVDKFETLARTVIRTTQIGLLEGCINHKFEV